MSDFGEVGYLPEITAADSCFKEAEHCDLGILIVGKRYGDDYVDGCSVTHGEFRTLHSKKRPILTLIEKDVMTFKNLIESNSGNDIQFPGMDRAKSTFDFIDEIGTSPYNNGILEFQNLSDARRIIRQQFAHIFGMLLRERFDPIRGDIRDILASIASLREELTERGDDPQALRFLRASRQLLEDDLQHYKKFLDNLLGSFDLSVRNILMFKSFDELAEASGRTMHVAESPVFDADNFAKLGLRCGASWSTSRRPNQFFACSYGISDVDLYITQGAKEQFEANHISVRAAAGS